MQQDGNLRGSDFQNSLACRCPDSALVQLTATNLFPQAKHRPIAVMFKVIITQYFQLLFFSVEYFKDRIVKGDLVMYNGSQVILARLSDEAAI